MEDSLHVVQQKPQFLPRLSLVDRELPQDTEGREKVHIRAVKDNVEQNVKDIDVFFIRQKIN